MLKAIQRLLRRDANEWDMTFVVGGEKAVALLKEGAHFDVIVSDLDMPEVNGVEVLDAAERLSPASRRILFTGSDVDHAAVNAHAVQSKLDPIATLRGIIALAVPKVDGEEIIGRRSTTLKIAIRQFIAEADLLDK